MAEIKEELKSLLMSVKKESERASLKLNIKKSLRSWLNYELPWVQAGFRKGRETRDEGCQHPLDHQKSKSSRKTLTSALLTMPKPLTVWITTNCGKFLKRWKYQAT